jgi:Uma2 family endonuclease
MTPGPATAVAAWIVLNRISRSRIPNSTQKGLEMATQETRLILGPEDDGRLLSAEEYASAEYREPWKYERVDGRLVVMAPDGFDHQVTAEPWRDHLGVYHVNHPDRVQHVFSNPWVRVDRGTDRIGDIGVYLVSDRPVPDPPDRPPDLMFEIVSPGREAEERDYILKRAEYYQHGIREYVVVDRFTRQVTVFTHTPEGYEERVLTRSDTYTSPLLPGLSIPLSDVL